MVSFDFSKLLFCVSETLFRETELLSENGDFFLVGVLLGFEGVIERFDGCFLLFEIVSHFSEIFRELIFLVEIVTL